MQIENDDTKKSLSQNEKSKLQSTDKTADRKKSVRSPSKSKADEFKRKYFEFYDDIKISDRQDW